MQTRLRSLISLLIGTSLLLSACSQSPQSAESSAPPVSSAPASQSSSESQSQSETAAPEETYDYTDYRAHSQFPLTKQTPLTLAVRRETGSTFCYAEASAIRRDFTETMPYGFACWENDMPVGLISCYILEPLLTVPHTV